MGRKNELLIGIDAGTSVVKAVAFTLSGSQVGCASIPNHYQSGRDGSATQSMEKTWADCVAAINALGREVPDLRQRTIGLSVTGQGDGTWLVNKKNQPVGDAWIWLDARAANTVEQLKQLPADAERFHNTGTGLNTCQQSAQLAHMSTHHPELLRSSDVALHCKDWLYLCLTGVRATDPSEASFTFGDFRTRRYSESVISALGLTNHRRLLPDIVDGSEQTHALSTEAALQVNLPAGLPVSLGYVDMVLTGLGAGVYTGDTNTACSIIGSTGVHMRPNSADQVVLNQERTGYVMTLPIPGLVTQMQSNMASTLNLDWLLNLISQLCGEFGHTLRPETMIQQLDRWLTDSAAGQLIYHPFISEAGERGPFINAQARASFIGLAAHHTFPDMVRAIVDGLAMATLDCYRTIGPMPGEIRMSGGAARSAGFRAAIASALGAPVRVSSREETGAAGAAMMSAVAIGAYPSMEACVAEWVTPLLQVSTPPEAQLEKAYVGLFDRYIASREALVPTWSKLPKASPL